MARIRASAHAWIGVLLAGVLVVAAAACGSSATSAPLASPAAPTAAHGDFAGLVDVGGGRKLYLECHGGGTPTVILQSGFGNAADVWSVAEAHPPPVMPGMASFTRVCAYDRPGSLRITDDVGKPADLPGRSTPVPPMPRNPADVVAELHDLLATAHVPGPYVMVGHSLGGALSLLYARTYPSQVVGLVTVDALVPPAREMYPPGVWNKTRHVAVSPNPVPGYRTEAYDVNVLYNEIKAAPPLRPMPVIVMVRGEPNPVPRTVPPPLTAADLTALNRVWPKFQAAFAASIRGARLVTVPGTTHYIQTQRPDTVIQAIRRVITLTPSPATTR